MTFRKDWRVYQSRLLEHLDRYLANRRLHLVAAPGSGKTVIGLEVIRRINQPTLVLAPTITIRDQWVDRLVDLFLPPGNSKPAWVSTELRNPALLTVATYQALHAVYSGEPEEPPADSEENGVHRKPLRKSRERRRGQPHFPRSHVHPRISRRSKFRNTGARRSAPSANRVVEDSYLSRRSTGKPTTVALTATPPYDVSPFEWQRYEELCGPIDAEVSVPELVQEGDLCPHQDYVYFSTPTPHEQKVISDFRSSVDTFVAKLKANVAFRDAILLHPWISAPDQNTEDILDDPEYLSSMVIYLNAVGQEVPNAVMSTLGLSRKRIPELNLEWLEVLALELLVSGLPEFHEKRSDPQIHTARVARHRGY